MISDECCDRLFEVIEDRERFDVSEAEAIDVADYLLKVSTVEQLAARLLNLLQFSRKES